MACFEEIAWRLLLLVLLVLLMEVVGVGGEGQYFPRLCWEILVGVGLGSCVAATVVTAAAAGGCSGRVMGKEKEE